MVHDDKSVNRNPGNDSSSLLADHKCFPGTEVFYRCLFCKHCGVYISQYFGRVVKEDPEVYVRSWRFKILDPNCTNSNLILDQMISRQSINRYYNTSAPNLNHRQVLIDWIKKICNNLNFSLTTFYCAVSYLDSIFSLYIIKDSQMKLIGYISVYLSSKMEEEDSKIPTISQTAKMFKNEYTEQEITNCEKFVCKILNYNMNVKTPFSFLMFFFSKGFVQLKDLLMINISDAAEDVVNRVEKLTIFLMDITISKYEFYQFTSIAIAAASMACARECFAMIPWTKDLERLTYVTAEALKECKDMIMELFKENHRAEYLEYFDVCDRAQSYKTTKCHDNISEMSTNEDLLNSENTELISNHTSLQQIEPCSDSMTEETDCYGGAENDTGGRGVLRSGVKKGEGQWVEERGSVGVQRCNRSGAKMSRRRE